MTWTCLLSIIALLLLGAWSAPAPNSHCYSTDPAPYRFYSTHSDYEDVRGRDTDFTLPVSLLDRTGVLSFQNFDLIVKDIHNQLRCKTQKSTYDMCHGCEPRLVYLLSRHGIRYPTTKEYTALKQRLPQLHARIVGSLANGTLCQADQVSLGNWTFRMTAENAEHLSGSGATEANELGQRFHSRFPDLFNASFIPDKYSFLHTWKPRTGESARNIALGLFNTTENIPMTVNAKGRDNVLRFFDSCVKVKQTIREKRIEEEYLFQRGQEMTALLHRVTNRLGLQAGELHPDDLDLLYKACAFEHAILQDSPWCVAFDTEDLRVLEYLHDVTYYWEYGYGHDLNYLQTCDLMRDVLGHLRDAANNRSSLTGVVRVGHDNTLLPLYTRLGLFNDTTPLMAHNMAEQSNREWRTSRFASFGSNIAFVLYNCGQQANVRTFVNEKPINIPVCSNQVCPLANILGSELGHFESSCNFDEICAYPTCAGHEHCQVNIVG